MAELARCVREAVALTEELCRRPSVSAEGRALRETAELVEELLAESGFATRTLQADHDAPAVYGELLGEHPFTLLLYNHYDVQPADPLEEWETPPFAPSLRDGRLYARGCADNKGEIAVRLAALRHVLRERGRLPFTVRWLIEGEEEIGSPHFEELVREHADLLAADACFWEGSVWADDGRPVIALGYKGALAVRLELRSLSSDAHSALAAVLPSAAWKLLGALSCIRAPDGRVLVPGFYEAVRPPTEAELLAISEQGEAIELALRAGYGPASFVDGVSGAELRERHSFAPTCNIAGLASGYCGPGLKTVLPREAAAQLDFRLVRDQHPERLFASLRLHLDERGYGDVQLTRLMAASPVATELDAPLVARVRAIAEAACAAPAKLLPSSPATQPVLSPLRRHLDTVGLAPPDNPAHQGSGIHAPNEHIRLDDLERALAFARRAFGELHLKPA